MIHIAIVEDEDFAADQLRGMIGRFEKEYGTATHIVRFRDGDEIVHGYDGSFDIILMDIQMRFMDGMSAAEEIRKMDQRVVIMFITNRTDYAIRGYEVDALDYIVKPVSYFAFAKKMQRAIGRVEKRTGHSVKIPVTQGMLRISTDDLLYVESEGHNLLYHTKQEVYRVRGKISSAEEELVPHGFFRCNKGYLVNMKYVQNVNDGMCRIGNENLLVSRAKRNAFLDALAEYFGEG